jgi:hypothetical protein
MASRSPSERALIARIAAASRWSREDPKDPNGPLPRARRAFLDRFEREVDPDGVLPAEERTRRATAAKTAYFARLALKSAQVRRRRAA